MLSDSQPRTSHSTSVSPSVLHLNWTNFCGTLIALLTLIVPIAIVTQYSPLPISPIVPSSASKVADRPSPPMP